MWRLSEVWAINTLGCRGSILDNKQTSSLHLIINQSLGISDSNWTVIDRLMQYSKLVNSNCCMSWLWKSSYEKLMIIYVTYIKTSAALTQLCVKELIAILKVNTVKKSTHWQITTIISANFKNQTTNYTDLTKIWWDARTQKQTPGS